MYQIIAIRVTERHCYRTHQYSDIWHVDSKLKKYGVVEYYEINKLDKYSPIWVKPGEYVHLKTGAGSYWWRLKGRSRLEPPQTVIPELSRWRNIMLCGPFTKKLCLLTILLPNRDVIGLIIQLMQPPLQINPGDRIIV